MCFHYLPLFFSVFSYDFFQEEIKINNVTVFVNPYTEPDEGEEEEKANDKKNTEDEENVGFGIL